MDEKVRPIEWARGFAWAMDFCRAVRERPWWARWLFRFVIGKYAYREFIGMQDTIAREGFDPYYDYGCQNVDYQRDQVPSRWWVKREPRPLNQWRERQTTS